MGICSAVSSPSTEPIGSASNPFVIKQGIVFRLLTNIKKPASEGGGPFNLTNYTGRAELRVNPEDEGAPVATFTVTNSATVTGQALVELPATITETILPGDYVFDVEFENNANPDDVIPGSPTLHAHFIPGVTKS